MEIASKIEIDRDFTIHHPDYLPVAIDPDIIDRFQRISTQLQQKFIIAQLRNYLYQIYFERSLLNLEDATATTQTAQIKNNLINGVDVNFYRRLQQQNTSQGYRDTDWKIIAETEECELIVVKDGLHLHIDRRHLPKQFHRATIGDLVSIYLPHNLVDRDTYIPVGNFGSPSPLDSVHLYFNFTPDTAVAIVHQLTHELNHLEIPFQFAILHNPALFNRCDAGTLWLSQASYRQAQPRLAEIYRAHRSGFSPQVPCLTKELAPGLGIAEVPVTGSSFGMQRCELLATGLLAAVAIGQVTTTDKLNSIAQEFTTASIDLLQPYLNPSGTDGYHSYQVN